MLEQKTISVRIDGDLYEYFKEEEIPISSIVQMLLKGFAKSDKKFDMLSESIEDGEFIKISEIERKVERIVETIDLKLWDEKTIKFMTDMSKINGLRINPLSFYIRSIYTLYNERKLNIMEDENGNL